MTEPGTGSPITVVDGHVHLHDCYRLSSFLDAARSNLGRAATAHHPGRPWVGVLCLAEGAREDGFGRLRMFATSAPTIDGGGPEGWRVRLTEEEESLRLTSSEGDTLFVLSGYQIRTRERLELLTLGTRTRWVDGQPLQEYLADARRDGAIPVVPWGFGKWTGRRRALVRGLVDASESPGLFLGDSANRPVFLRRSRLFEEAEAEGVYDLPGSDPLPFPSECGRVGRAGFVLTHPLDPAAPAADLKRSLNGQIRPHRFLRREGPLRFLRNQVIMQRRKGGPTGQAASG